MLCVFMKQAANLKAVLKTKLRRQPRSMPMLGLSKTRLVLSPILSIAQPKR
jgi:hypothetical protein